MLHMPLPLIADAGTPLMIVGSLYLIVGNFFIGIIEALIVRWLFKVKGFRLFLWVIVANYASFIAGMILLSYCTESISRAVGGELPIYSINRIEAVLIVFTFIVTIIVEWPFYWLGTRSVKFGRSKSFLANLVANFVSYWILAALFFSGKTPDVWGFRLVPASKIAPFVSARIIYLSPHGDEVLSLRIGETTAVRLFPVSPSVPEGGLAFVRGSKSDQWQLMLKPVNWDNDSPPVKMGLIYARQATTQPIYSDGESYPDWMWYGGMFVSDLRSKTDSKWDAFLEPGIYPQTIIDSIPKGKEYVISPFEISMMTWADSFPTILPNDELVFSLGPQIMVADLDRDIVAAVATGRSPVVILDEPNSTRFARQ